MSTHVPKRVYTASALEGWFNALAGDWERFFTEHELSVGQEFYQNGTVTSIELQKDNAIFHAKLDGKDTYALVEWEKDAPKIRSSSPDKLVGAALAVAGLYETEEMVVESVSPLPPESLEDKEKKAQAAKSSGGSSLFADDAKKKSGGTLFAGGAATHPILRPMATSQPRAYSAPAPVAPASRTLQIKISVISGAITLDAYWENADETLEPALKLYKKAPAHVTEAEREKLIRLTALARKCGWELQGKTHDYFLKDFQKITDWVKNEIDVWKKYFHVELTPDVLLLGRGIQTITVEVEARGTGEELRFHWLFLLHGTELAQSQVKEVLTAGRQAVLLPPLGLVKLSDEQADVIADWRDIILEGSGALPRYMLFSLFRQDALPIRLSKELEEWTRSLLEETKEIPVPLDCLRDYQKKGISWLAHMLSHKCHPLLADEMGLGKTLQMLTLLTSSIKNSDTQRPSVVVAPASVVPVWAMELQSRFPGYKFEILSGENLPQNNNKTLWLASYGQLKRHADDIKEIEFDYAVLDEAQMIKNPQTKSAKACYGLKAQHRLAMTGTPVENHPMDLWSIFRFLMPGLLGGSTRFAQMADDEALSPQLLQRIHQQVSPFILRRTKVEVAKELPEKVETVLVAPLSERQQSHYAKLVEQGLKRFGNDLRNARQRGLAFFTLLTRLRQASCDAGLLPWVKDCPCQESGKIAILLEQLDGIIAAGSKVVIFSQFVGFLKRIESAIDEKFPNIPRYQLTGATLDRQRPVSEFQNSSGPAIMLVSLRAGGTGITLHAADYLFLMDPWWNPAVEDQAIDRVHRLGQKKTVFVYRVVSEGTIEHRIQSLKAQKRELFQNLVGNIRDNTNFALYFRSMNELIELAPKETEEE